MNVRTLMMALVAVGMSMGNAMAEPEKAAAPAAEAKAAPAATPEAAKAVEAPAAAEADKKGEAPAEAAHCWHMPDSVCPVHSDVWGRSLRGDESHRQ